MAHVYQYAVNYKNLCQVTLPTYTAVFTTTIELI